MDREFEILRAYIQIYKVSNRIETMQGQMNCSKVRCMKARSNYSRMYLA